MKNILLAVCGLALAASSAWAQNAKTSDARPEINVSGEAVVYAVPDKILVRVGVETQDKDMVKAKQESNEILQKVFAAVKECGVKKQDIQTEYLYAEPQWSSSASVQKCQYYQVPPPLTPPSNGEQEESRRFLGYFVKNTIVVTLRDTSKIDKLITDVLEAGATHIYGVQFQASELDAHHEKARELALIAAKEKAEKMAAVLGQSIGAPVMITEGSAPSFDPFYCAPSGMSSVGESQNTTIALGKLAIRATVNVTFELKQGQTTPHPRPAE